jgi:hypothetical protein
MNAPELVSAIRAAFEPGVFYGMPAEQYHKSEALSASGGRKLRQSPLHYKLMRDTPNEPTAAMEFGTVVHAGVLEPDAPACYAVAPKIDTRTTAGKADWGAFAQANAGRIILSQADADRALACIAAVRAHPGASRLLAGAKTEVSLFWEDAKYKVPCKCRWDGLNRGGGFDLKTTQDASPDAFARTIASYEYHAAAAHYISGAEHVLNESPRFFAFIAVESEPPHAVACYALPSNAILAGQHLVAIALERYAEALVSGKWRGYSDLIDTIELPRWALRFS